MANSVAPGNGFVVVTHVYPQQGQAQPQGQAQHQGQVQQQAQHQGGQTVTAPATSATSQLGKFLQRDPAALGTIEIMLGIVIFLFGIMTTAFPLRDYLLPYSGIMFWGAIIYIIAGSLTVRANKDLNSSLVKGSLGMNIVCTLVAGTAVILHSLEFIFMDVDRNCPYSSDYYTCSMHVGWASGSNGVMLVLTILELILSICISAFACKSTCNCCYDTEQVAYFIPNPMTMAPHTAPLNTSEMTVGQPSGAPFCKPGDLPPIYTQIIPEGQQHSAQGHQPILTSDGALPPVYTEVIQ